MSKNLNAERHNPCLKEQEMSYKCLDDNGYDREKCNSYFDNYNTCKKFWGQVYSDRRKKGIKPYLPEIEERNEIKANYLSAKIK